MMAPARPLGRYAYDDAEEASADRRSAYSARRPVTDRRTPGGMGYRAAKKYDASWPPAREREWDYDPAGPPEKGSLANTRKREDKVRIPQFSPRSVAVDVLADIEGVPSPCMRSRSSWPRCSHLICRRASRSPRQEEPASSCVILYLPPCSRLAADSIDHACPLPFQNNFQATFKGVDFTIAHNAYKTFLRDNGVRSARAADVGIKDTALFYVKTPKELRLAMDRLPVRVILPAPQPSSIRSPPSALPIELTG